MGEGFWAAERSITIPIDLIYRAGQPWPPREYNEFEAWIDLAAEASPGTYTPEGGRPTPCGRLEFYPQNKAHKWGWRPTQVYRWISRLEEEGLVELEGENPRKRVLILVDVSFSSSGNVSINSMPGKTIKGRKTKRRDRPGFVYLMKSGDLFKIGMSRNPESRLKQVRSPRGSKAHLVAAKKSKDMLKDEKGLHSRFSEKRVEGEWFSLCDQDVSEILESFK